MSIQRRVAGVLACLSMVALVGCGGGGDSDGKDLTVDFRYPTMNFSLWGTVDSRPTLAGLGGNSPSCQVVSGVLPRGVQQSGCNFTGRMDETGIFGVTVRLTVSGYKGHIDTGASFNAAPVTVRQDNGQASWLGWGDQILRQMIRLDGISGPDADEVVFTLQSGSLPTGLTLQQNGTLTGSTTELGPKTFTVGATLRRGTQQHVAVPGSVSIEVMPAVMGYQVLDGYVACCSIPLGRNITVTAMTSGVDTGTKTFTLVSGVLPTGLSLDTATGNISGVPTVIEQPNVLVRVNLVHANGAVAQAERTVNFAVRFDRGPSYDPPVPYVWRLGQLVNVAAPTLPDSRPGDTYTFSLETENSLPYPTWLQINPATGALTGTAAGATGQQYYFRVVASLVGNSLYRVSFPYSVVTQ